MFFHAPNGATREEVLSGNVKEFTVDKDTPYLLLPGLVGPIVNGKLTVERVRINGVDLPARRSMHVRDFRLTEDKLPAIPMDMPMFDVMTGQDGTPVLVRNVCSNNGKWQARAVVSVWAEWSGDVEKKATAKPREDKAPDPREIARATIARLTALPPDKLAEQAAALGVLPPEGATPDQIIPMILKASGLPVEPMPSYTPGQVPASLLAMSMEELRKVAADYNVVYKPGTSREAFARQIATGAGYPNEE